MKNKSIRIVLPVVVFAAVLLTLSCAQPTNQNANTTPKGDVCEGDINAREDKVREGIEKKIKDKPKLKKQFEDNKFSYVVQKSSNGEYVEAIFTGELKGDDELKD